MGKPVLRRRTSVRTLLLQEAAAYALDNRVTADWRARLERRSAAQPAAEQWKAGLALLLAAEGREEDSRRMMAALPARIRRLRRGAGEEFEDRRGCWGSWKEAARLAARLPALRKAPDVSLSHAAGGFSRPRRDDAGGGAGLDGGSRAACARCKSTNRGGGVFGRIGDEDQWEKFYRAAARLGGARRMSRLRLGLLALGAGGQVAGPGRFSIRAEGHPARHRPL